MAREYVGGGIVGELAARMDAEERRRREEDAAYWKEELERLDALEEPVRELCEAAELLVQAALVVAGYRQHNRGEWRKRRDAEED